MTNFNTEPFYDDYDKHKHFYRILFRPGYAVQNREMIQMQTMLQEQIRRAGDHLFKNGTMVIPGELSFNSEFQYVKLNALINSVAVSSFISQLEGLIVIGATSGVRAQVIKTTVSTETDPDTLFVSYLSQGTNGEKVFAANETISPEDIQYVGLSVITTMAPTGVGSGASVKEGVYYINGHFVLCEDQTIILDKYTNTPSYSIGFEIDEKIVTPEDDESLLDNAQGSYNFAAPGAYRHSITLVLAKKTDYNNITDAARYIQLTKLENGVPQTPYNTTQYAELAKTLARRTYDESGDYVVKEFKYNVREHRDNNRGTWQATTPYEVGDIVTYGGNYYCAITTATSGTLGTGGSWPTDPLTTFNDGGVLWRYTIRPKFNNGLLQGGDSDYFALAIDAGKAYVKGYEVEKIATSYHKLPKALTWNVDNDAQINEVAGNYVLVTGMVGLPDLATMQKVYLYSNLSAVSGDTVGLVGTAFVRAFEFHSGTIGQASAIYKLGLFNVNLNAGVDFSRKVKTILSPQFNSKVSAILTAMPGTVTTVGTAVTGTGTIFTNLVAGDVISIEGSLYTLASTPSNNNSLTLTTAPSPAVSVGVTAYLATTQIVEPQHSNLIFTLPKYVKSARDGSGINDIKYSVSEYFTGVTDVSGNIVISLPADGSANTFGSIYGIGNYILSNSTGIVAINSVVLSNGDKTATIGTSLGNGVAVKVIARVEKSGTIANEKTKTLTYTAEEITTAAIGQAKIINLTKADGKSTFSIMMKSGTWASPTGDYDIDISSRFSFDPGQTDSYYGMCRLFLNEGQAVPTAPFKVTYSYFEHVGEGDYFTINSYGSIKESYITSFNGISMRHAIDFRPRIGSTGVFNSNGGKVSHIPFRGDNITLSYQFFLPRMDKVVADSSGAFLTLEGIPSLNPSTVATPETGMHLASLQIEPHTAVPADYIKIIPIDNRRYTMRDIGALDRRITNLEYYTTLSLSEQNTNNMHIPDELGLNRFKNGFIVDSFNGHGIGDSRSLDYRCAIDPRTGTLRPVTILNNVALIEQSSANRVANNYTLTGDLLTLPYTEVIALAQTHASRTENVNPFAVYSFAGAMEMNPVSDDWMETYWAPDIMLYNNDSYNQAIAANNGMEMQDVWNSWETTWTGSVYDSGSMTPAGAAYTTGGTQTVTTRQVRTGSHSYNKGTETTTTTSALYSTQDYIQPQSRDIIETRVGVRNTVTYTTTVEATTDKTIESHAIQYMRSRNVAFVVRGLKSSTRLYSTFDSIDVAQYVTPATLIRLNDIAGASVAFDANTNAAENSEHSARQVGNSLDKALNKGHILKGGTSGATAIVMYVEPRAAGQTYTNLYVINIKGTFVTSEVIFSSMDGNTSTNVKGTLFDAPTVGNPNYKLNVMGDILRSNHTGIACGILTIPNNSALKFLVGNRELFISDIAVGSLTPPATYSSGIYSATGIYETKAKQYISTRLASIVSTPITETLGSTIAAGSRPITTTTLIAPASTVVSGAVEYVDPLAQTFIVDTNVGAFITAVDLFFQSKDATVPVSVEIREVVNGMPTQIVLPFARKHKMPSEVTISETGALATKFTFPSPVHLEDGKEYAIVVLSDSNSYNVFISDMGGTDLITGREISSQPALGVLFKSSNSSTWNANQMQDLKFNLYKAKFDTVNTGNVTFANAPIPLKTLITNPLLTKNGSNVVRVRHANHGMSVGSTVTLSGIAPKTGFSDINGIPTAELNGNKIIANVTFDSYTITSTTNATSTGPAGGANVYASENDLFNLAHINTSQLIFNNTSIDYLLKTTSGQSIGGSETPYVLSGTYTSFNPGSSIAFNSPRVVASAINESVNMASVKSFSVLAMLKTSNENVSPVIDIQRFSAILVGNKVNAPTLANTNVTAIDSRTVVSGANLIGFDATTNSFYTALTNTSTVEALKTLMVGKYVTISGSTFNGGQNNGNALVTEFSEDVTNYYVKVSGITYGTVAANADVIVVVSNDLFIDETAPKGGSTINKYVSKEIILSNPSTYIRAQCALNVPPLADVEFYYRTNTIGSAQSLADLKWIKMNPNETIKKNSSDRFVDTTFEIANIPSFDTVQVKIVLKSSSSSQVPQCRQLRIIACA